MLIPSLYYSTLVDFTILSKYLVLFFSQHVRTRSLMFVVCKRDLRSNVIERNLMKYVSNAHAVCAFVHE